MLVTLALGHDDELRRGGHGVSAFKCVNLLCKSAPCSPLPPAQHTTTFLLITSHPNTLIQCITVAYIPVCSSRRVVGVRTRCQYGRQWIGCCADPDSSSYMERFIGVRYGEIARLNLMLPGRLQSPSPLPSGPCNDVNSNSAR